MKTKKAIQTVRGLKSKAAKKRSLPRQADLFHFVTEHAEDFISIIDRTGKRLYNSPSYSRLLGPPEKLRGTDSFREIHPEDRERIKKLFKESMPLSFSGGPRRRE